MLFSVTEQAHRHKTKNDNKKKFFKIDSLNIDYGIVFVDMGTSGYTAFCCKMLIGFCLKINATRVNTAKEFWI